MTYTVKQKLQIHLKAKRKLGRAQKQSASDKYLFMQQCVDQLVSEGDEDESSARDVCELLWEEGSDLFD